MGRDKEIKENKEMAYNCDKCDIYPAKYFAQGVSVMSLYDGLCSRCCADYLEAIGDKAGANKFRVKS